MSHSIFRVIFIVLSMCLLASATAAQGQDNTPSAQTVLSLLNVVRLQAETIAEQADATERAARALRAKASAVAATNPSTSPAIEITTREADRLAALAKTQLDRSAELFKEAERLSEEIIVASRRGKETGGSAQDQKADTDRREQAYALLTSATALGDAAGAAALQVTELTNKLSGKTVLWKYVPDRQNSFELSNKPVNDEVFADFNAPLPTGRASQLSNSINCIDEATCTPVSIFFGTDRAAQRGASRLFFTAARNDKLTLGKAIVTVPKANRHKGDVNRPSWWDLLHAKNPWREDPTIHFTIPDGGITVFDRPEEFLAAAQEHMANGGDFKDHVFVFVHGFNTEFDDALYRAAQITFDLGNGDVPFGTAFLYSWPSSGGVEHYVDDFDSARLAVPHFKSFLQLVMQKTGAKHVHLIAHSMGNWPLITVLHDLAAETANQAKVDQIILAAPDIDAGEFGKIADNIKGIATGITLYVSSNDRAMYASRRVHGDKWRAGDVPPPPAGPVIVSGIESVDVSTLNTDWLSLNHSTYAASKELLNDIWLLMRESKHPPDSRNNNFQLQTLAGQKFWRYAQ